MNKTDLISKAGEVLRTNDIKRMVSVPDYSLYVMDEDGDKKKFTVSIPDRYVNYTRRDVSNCLEAILAVIEDCVKHGEEVNIYGFGTLKLSKRAAGMMKVPDKDEWYEVPEHYIPYVKIGAVIKQAARYYDGVLKDSEVELLPPIYDFCESEDYE